MRQGRAAAHKEEGKNVTKGEMGTYFAMKDEGGGRKEEAHQESFQREIRGRCRERMKWERSG